MKLPYFLLFVTSLSFSQQVPEDKMLHVMAGGMVAGVSFPIGYHFTKNDKTKAFIYSMIATTLVATVKEISDSREPLNHFDVQDLGCTIIGGTFVNLTYVILLK